jgi:cation diffusion facilitator CzcD-associated flavoprotein CzcO
MSDRERRWLKRFPWLMSLWRKWLYATYELRIPALKIWPRLMSIPERRALQYMRKAIVDPVLRHKVTPSYRMGCVRILFSNDYYPALARPNVELVTDSIAELTPRGLRTSDGREREVDVVIYATGFRVSDYLTPLHIVGSEGRELSSTWRNDGESYLGISISGFPNLYLLRGPNTALGHSSTILMSEAQADYALSCIETLRKTGARTMDVRRESQSDFTNALQAEFSQTVWSSGCTSFHTDNPTGKNTYMWPGSSFDYWLRTRRVRSAHYDIR